MENEEKTVITLEVMTEERKRWGVGDCFNPVHVEMDSLGLDQKAVHHGYGRINRRGFINLALAPPSALGISSYPHAGGGSNYWFRCPQE